MALCKREDKMVKNKKKQKATGHSWLASGSSSSFDSGNIDSENSVIEGNEEEIQQLRESMKGFPLIGKLKKQYQYSITVALAVLSLSFTMYSGFNAYSNSQQVNDVDIAINNLSNSVNVVQYEVSNYAGLNEDQLNNLASNKSQIDNYIGTLRSNSYFNKNAIATIDDFWKIYSQKVNTIVVSKDNLSHNDTLISNSLSELKVSIDAMKSMMNNISNRSDVPAYKSLYLSQILSDTQSLYYNLNALRGMNVDYNDILSKISNYNPIISKKISMLLKANLPTDIANKLNDVYGNIDMASNNINTVIQRISPIQSSLLRLKNIGTDITSSVDQVKSSISIVENHNVFNNYIMTIVSFFAFILFFISVFMINAKELNKDLMISEEKRKSMENSMLRIINDVNVISGGDYTRKVRNTTDNLIGLKDAINKLVENFIDKFHVIHKISMELKSDNQSYERLYNFMSERTTAQTLNKSEMRENEKVIDTLMVEIKSGNNEIVSIMSNVYPDFQDAVKNMNLLMETNKEIENIKNNIKIKHYKISENFLKIKEGLDNLNKLSEFIEALSLNSEILNKKSLNSSSFSSFNRIAEDFSKKVNEIKSQCNNMKINIEDAKNDLSSIVRTSEDLDKHYNDNKGYLNAIKRIFSPLSNLLSVIKVNQTKFKTNTKQINSINNVSDDLRNALDEYIKNSESSLAEIKELNKLSKMKSNEIYQKSRFVEQLSKD